MRTFLDITRDDLDQLDAADAEDLFRELLWAEASRIGIGKHLIDVPTRINVADGGIDAEVKEVEVDTRTSQGIIKKGITRYQIKTGDFDPRDILFSPRTKSSKSPALRPRVKSCLDKNGTLVVVLFGMDNPDREDDQAITAVKQELLKYHPDYTEAKIEVWAQHKLIGFLKPFPSLALKVKGLPNAKFQTHESWANDDEMTNQFVPGESQRECISIIRNNLREQGPLHLAIVGASGIGKTRLVLEATDESDLKPLVAYFSDPQLFLGGPIYPTLLREDNEYTPILIIDECDHSSQRLLGNKLKNRKPPIKLITITRETEAPSEIPTVKILPLEREHLKSILADQYNVPTDYALQWAEVCGGYPRMAHFVGRGLQHSDRSVWTWPDLNYAIDLIIAGEDSPSGEQYRTRRTVLEYFSLFTRVGYGQPYGEEGKYIAVILERHHGIKLGQFHNVVQHLRERRILQGETTLYITPKIVHIRMWINWWQTYSNERELISEMITNLPDTLSDYFFQMFEYADPISTPGASQVIREILSASGIFEQGSAFIKTERGARFFRYLATAEPEPALKYLLATIGTWSKDELLQFTTGRREVIYALERIARWRGLFSDAARLLLALGEAENESWSNNASGIFAELFSFQIHREVSRTEASPAERFPVLREAMESDSPGKRRLGLKACRQALTTYQGGMVINRPRIVGREPEPWTPATWGDLWDAYKLVWEYLSDRVDELQGDEQIEAAQILLDSANSLIGISYLEETILKTLRDLTQKEYVDARLVIKTVVQILHYGSDSLSDSVRVALEQLREESVGLDFGSLLKRYVGMNLLEDKIDKEGKPRERLNQKLAELATQAIEKIDILIPELEWLVTVEAVNGFAFGAELANRDSEHSLLPLILEAQREAESSEASAYLLGGYMHVVAENKPSLSDKYLASFAEDEELVIWVPELVFRTNRLTDDTARLMLNLLENNKIEVSQLHWFSLGGVIRQLSPEVLDQWLRFLRDSEDPRSIYIALSLVSYYYVKGTSAVMPEQLALELLTHQSLTQPTESDQRSRMSEYHWRLVAGAFFQTYPHRGLDLAEFVLANLGTKGTIIESFYSKSLEVLNQIIRQDPVEMWQLITDQISPPRSRSAFWITRWLRGDYDWGEQRTGALIHIPPDIVWQWVDVNIDERAWYLATFVPPILHRDKDTTCWPRELLLKYGERDDVRRNLVANFSTEGYMGPASLHYQRKRQMLLEFLLEEEDINVRAWLSEYIDELERDIERAKIEEERER